MKREELDKYLYELRSKINKDNAKELLLLLDDVFKIKPVTILYFNVKAKLLCEIGKYEEAAELLNGKINICFPEKEYIESCKILQRICKALNREAVYKKYCCYENYLRYMLELDKKSLIYIRELEERIIKLENKFLKFLNNTEIQVELSDAYFESMYTTEATIMYALSIKEGNNNYNESEAFNEKIAFEINHTFLLEYLLYENGSFIIVSNTDNYNRSRAIANALKKLNQKVFVIMPAVSVQVENKIELSDTIEISMNNLELDENGIVRVRPVELVYGGEIIGNNTHLILEQLSKATENDFSILLSTGRFFTSLNNISGVKKRMQRLSAFTGDFFENNFAFGYFGNYTSYISNIYGFDVQNEINKPNECEFSIVIPVRNSAESLRYTLLTCLEQREINYKDYEIVISDNSNSEYIEVEKLVKEMNDSRIKYFRTPKELPLSRSFEYAFLKAKGEFIFAIGADDAVLPWGLKTIREALKKLPNDDVVQWDRGFFVWPNNDKATSQAGQFLISKPYKDENIKIQRQKSIDKLMRVVINPSEMYGMPMLYINSGFRRSYIKKILASTGRLWDGTSQDIYMGLVNLLINETIPNLEYPITIAGMTVASEGINSNRGNRSNKKVIKRIFADSAFGIVIPYGDCHKFLHVDLDIGVFYSSFFRVLELEEKGTMSIIASGIDWKKVFHTVASGLACDDLRYDFNIKSLRYSAYYHSDKIGEWFDNTVLDIIMSPKNVVKNEQKSYFEGFTQQGGLQLDARKFGVTNIYEATKLFENICNL